MLREEFVEAAIADAPAARARQSGSHRGDRGHDRRASRPRRSWDTRERDVAISAAVLCDGEMRGIYHKVLLPNYEVFDEARNFAPGRRRPTRCGGSAPVVAGIAICEDLLVRRRPARGAGRRRRAHPARPERVAVPPEKPAGRLALAAEVARRNGVPVVYVNSVGGQDELVFDGGSLVVDADGELLYRARQFEPERFCVDVPLGPARPLTAPTPTTVHARAPRLRAAARRRRCPRPRRAATSRCGARSSSARATSSATTARPRVVLGLSGGIDAAVTAAVAAEALGPENVLGVAMPSPDSPAEELEDARDARRGARASSCR